MCSGFYSEHFLYIGASDTINVSQRNFLRLNLEFLKADIAMPAAQRITPPSVTMNCSSYRGYIRSKHTYSLNFKEIINLFILVLGTH